MSTCFLCHINQVVEDGRLCKFCIKEIENEINTERMFGK
jgi:hypothetical protein